MNTSAGPGGLSSLAGVGRYLVAGNVCHIRTKEATQTRYKSRMNHCCGLWKKNHLCEIIYDII